MRIYTVHVRRPIRSQERDVVIIREGFAWLAFMFSGLWALFHRLWLVALLLIILDVAVSVLMSAFDIDDAISTVISVGLAVIIGYVGYDLWRWTLSRRGYAEVTVISACDRDDAERQFYQRFPNIADEVPA